MAKKSAGRERWQCVLIVAVLNFAGFKTSNSREKLTRFILPGFENSISLLNLFIAEVVYFLLCEVFWMLKSISVTRPIKVELPLKWRATGLDASVLFCSASRRCSQKRSASLLPVSPL